MSTTLYRKYRPKFFADVVGQKHIVQTLENALKLGRVGQAYLFTGPRGTGKTTLARLFAKAVNCSDRKGAEPCGKCTHCLVFSEGRSLDVIEIDAASHTGVDNIRELRETVNLPPSLGSHKIYIIDEVHMLSIGAFNALLKTLEEPPAHVIFILATTALHKVPETIVSRCQRFDLSRFPVKAIVGKLEKIAKQEKLKIEKGALEMIALAAEGGMRDAESLLTQIASLDLSPITEEKTAEILGSTKRENVTELLRLISENELFSSLLFIRKLSQEGVDLSVFSGLLLHFLRDVLIISADPKQGPDELSHLTNEQQASVAHLATLFAPEKIIRMLEYFQIAQRDTKTAVIPELPLEIAVVKILTQESKSDSSENSSNTPLPKEQETRQTSSPETPVQKSAIKKAALPIEPESSSSASTETTLDLSVVKKSWQAILDAAKQLNASISLALSNSRPVETEGSTVIIAVRYPFHKERLDEPANRLTLEKAFDTILGSRTKLRVVLDKTESKKDPADHPLINQAMEMLGGRIVPEH